MLRPVLGEATDVLTIVPIIIGAYLGGIGPGLLATAVSVVVSDYYLLPPVHSWTLASRYEAIELGVLLFVGVLVSILSEALHRATDFANDRKTLQQTTLASIGDAVITTDTAGRVSYMNSVAEAMTGYTLAEAEGQALQEVFFVVHAESRTRVEDCVQKVRRLATAVGSVERTLLIARDGRETPIIESGAPIRRPDGTDYGIVLVFRDASDQQRVEGALRAQLAMQAQLSRVIATAPGVIYSYELTAGGRSRVPFASPGLSELFGIPAATLLETASGISDRFDDADRGRVAQSIRRSAETLTVWHEEFRYRRDDGSYIWLEARSMPERMPDGSTVWHGYINDITARKTNELALRETRETLHTLIEQAPVSIAIFDLSMTYIAASRKWLTDYEGTSADVLGHNHYDLHPEASDEWRAVHRECLAGAVRTAECDRVVRADGSVQWLRWAVHPWKSGAGAIGGLIIFSEDIITRVEGAELQRTTERRYRDLVQMSPDAILVLHDGAVSFANDAALCLFRATPESLIGRAMWANVPAGDMPAILRRLEELRAGAAPSPLRHRIVRIDGSEVDVESVTAVFRDGDGVSAQVVMRDITERRQSELLLEASDARFRQLAESIREVFWLTDANKSAIEYISPAYESIWGRSAESVRRNPRDWMDAIHELDRDRVRQAALTKQATGEYDEQYRILRPDGTIRWIRDRAFPVRDSEGKVIRIAGTAEDITEQRQLESQLRQTQKLESVGLLAGGVAHDFNNWLTVISGNVELLQMTTGHKPELMEFVNEIRHAGDRAASLTRQLLAFSRQQVLEPKTFDVNTVVADTEKMLQRLIGEDIVLEHLARSRGKVTADPGHLVQVLMNLAVNARDAMPRGGRLTIATRDVVLDDAYALTHAGARAGSYVELSVTDTGSGMTPEVRTRLFEPFFTTKEVGRGTGLGLSVVHGIVAQSGGHIDVVSELGVGTAFRILLPSSVEALSASGSYPIVPEHGGRETLLVVEDEASVRRIAMRTLRSAGYTVLEAADGPSALRLLATHNGTVDLLMTDVVMPGMGGRELADAVRAERPGTQVLYTSGYTDDAVVRHGVLQAEVAFLQKPYNGRALLAKVRSVLDRPHGVRA